MTVILAIDPGSAKSAWLVLRDGMPAVIGSTTTGEPMAAFGIADNEDLLESLRVGGLPNGLLGIGDVVAIEWMTPRGMPTSAQEFETLWWAGQFTEAAHPTPVERVSRLSVKRHLCGKVTANDANIRAALIDRFGGIGGKAAAVGLKASPGPLFGISNDVWAALAVAITYAEAPR